MFREMRRNKQLLAEDVSREILERNTSGVLSLLGDEGYPYGVPLSYVLVEDKIFFHCAKTGHKIDAIMNCDKASFCVFDQGFRKEGEWALNIRSVIVFGRIEIVEDQKKLCDIATELSHKFTDDEEYIRSEIEHSAKRTLLFALSPEHMTGKFVNEA